MIGRWQLLVLSVALALLSLGLLRHHAPFWPYGIAVLVLQWVTLAHVVEANRPDGGWGPQ